MQLRQRKLFVLGGSGFIGKPVVREAIRRGFLVKILVRDPAKVEDLASIGAAIVQGNANYPSGWVAAAADCDVLIDLVQPELPNRIGLAEIQKIAHERCDMTGQLLAAMKSIPVAERPLLLSVSGIDDLNPDASGQVDSGSALRTNPVGFGRIGIPVRRLIEQSELPSAFVYLGTVYGPGKAFAKTVLPRLAAGKFRMAGSGTNRMPIVHVEDAARALVHLAGLPRASLAGRSFVVCDGTNSTMAEFVGHAAELMGAPRPLAAPLWLARMFVGSVLCETLTRDIRVDPSALFDTGFEFRYPSYRQGLPPTLKDLGYSATKSPALQPGSPLDSRIGFWMLFLGTISALVAVNSLTFPFSVPWMKHLSGGMPILDMQLWYSYSTVHRLFNALGQTGREAYLKELWTLDLVMPSLFGLFLFSAMKHVGLARLRWLAFAAAACDYCENIAITLLLMQYPALHPESVFASSMLTSMKWILYSAAALLTLIGLIRRVVNSQNEVLA